MLHAVMRRASTVGAISTRPITRRHAATASQVVTDTSVPRSFTSFDIYKGKGAVQFRPRPPTFKQIVTREAEQLVYGYKVDKPGVLMAEFANASAQQGDQSSYGARTYDWNNKILIALSPIELAQICDDAVLEPNKSIDIFHETTKGARMPLNTPKITKSLRFQLAMQSGYTMTCSMVSGGDKRSVSVPLTRAEYATLKHLANYIIPRLYGFEYLFEAAGVPDRYIPHESALNGAQESAVYEN